MRQMKKNKLFPILFSILLLVWVILFNFFINKAYFVPIFLDADGAAEIQLARTMYENGEWVFSTNWYYSTELRFLHNQLFMRPLFGFFNSSIGVHLAATLLINCFMALCALLLFLSLNLPFWQAVLGAALIVTPFSREVFYVNLANCYYSMFTAFLFLFLALNNFRLNCQKPFVKRGLLAFMLVLSFLLGMCGIRFSIILFIPALLVCAVGELRSFKKYNGINAALASLKNSITWLIFTFAFGMGYIFYEKVLLTIYTVADMPGLLTLSTIEDFVSKLREVPILLLRLFSELVPTPAMSPYAALKVFLLFLFFFMLVCGVYLWLKRGSYSTNQKFYINFSWATFFISILAMALATSSPADDTATARYLIPGVLPLATLPLLLFHNRQTPSRQRYAGLAAVVCVLLFNPLALALQCKNFPKYNYTPGYGTAELQIEIQNLQQQGFESGYGTFVYTGLINVLSSNTLETVGIYISTDRLQYRTWLEPKNHERINQSDAPQFLVLSTGEYEESKDLFADLPVLSQNRNFTILQIENIELLLYP